MSNITPPRRPRASRPDPLHEAKQAVAFYGEEITPAQVKSLLAALRGFRKNEKGYASDRGPIAAKHYTQGHRSAMSLAEGILIDTLLEPGQPFEDLLQRWSRSGAHSRVFSILFHLEEAIEAGIWGSQE